MTRTLSSDVATGRRRSPSAHDAILAATHALLEEVGYHRLTIEGVAARAGVGKATIYRWWPTKGALVVEAFLTAVAPTIAFPETNSARQDIAAQMRRLARVYRGKTARIVKEMIGSGQFEPETMTLFYEGYLKPRRAAAKAAIQRGIDQGEFRRDVDVDDVIDALYAPIFHRILIGHKAADDRFLGFLAEVVLGGIATAADDGRK